MISGGSWPGAAAGAGAGLAALAGEPAPARPYLANRCGGGANGGVVERVATRSLSNAQNRESRNTTAHGTYLACAVHARAAVRTLARLQRQCSERDACVEGGWCRSGVGVYNRIHWLLRG